MGRGLVTIGIGAFADNPFLDEIVIHDAVREIRWAVFRGCGLRTVQFGAGVEYIGYFAFSGNTIIVLNLPAKLKTIKVGAFSENNIRSLVIPEGVTTIESASFDYHISGVFDGNPVEAIIIPASLASRRGQNFYGYEGTGIYRGALFGGYESGLYSPEDPRYRMPVIPCVTLPANMDEGVMSGNFETTLLNFYVSQGKAAGNYFKRGPVWVMISNEEAAQFHANLSAW